MRHALAVHCPGCNQPIEVLLAVNHGPRWGNTHITLDRPINHICQEDPMTIHADRDGSEQPAPAEEIVARVAAPEPHMCPKCDAHAYTDYTSGRAICLECGWEEQPVVWPPKQRRDAEAKGRADGGPIPDDATQNAPMHDHLIDVPCRADCPRWSFVNERGRRPGCYEVGCLCSECILRRAEQQRLLGTSPVEFARAAHASGGEAVEPVRASEAQVEAAMRAAAAWDAEWAGDGPAPRVSYMASIADAVVAAGPDVDEVARLRERERAAHARTGEAIFRFTQQRLRADSAEAEVERLRATGLRHLDYFKAMRASRAEVEARANRLAATVERVEALADVLDTERRACEKRGAGDGPTTVARKNRTMRRVYERVLVDLRAALSAPEPVPTTPETPHTPAGDAESASGESGEAETLGGAESGEAHEHKWLRQQNVTTRGYAMDAIEVCECGVARKADR